MHSVEAVVEMCLMGSHDRYPEPSGSQWSSFRLAATRLVEYVTAHFMIALRPAS
jgi:hypothetical protein